VRMLNLSEIELVAGGWGTTGETLDGMPIGSGDGIEVNGRRGVSGWGFGYGYVGPDTGQGNFYPGDPADLGAGGGSPPEIVVTAPDSGDTQRSQLLQKLGEALLGALTEKAVDKAASAMEARRHETVINNEFSNLLTTQDSTKVQVTASKDIRGGAVITWYDGERFANGKTFIDSDRNGSMDIVLYERNGTVYYNVGDGEGYRSK
jgi:hypothetical protein